MANRKSLGSSPIGLPTDERDTLDFIPDLNGNGGESSRSAGDTSSEKSPGSGPPPIPVRREVKKLRARKSESHSPAAEFDRKQTDSGDTASRDTNGTTNGSGSSTVEKKPEISDSKSAGSEKKIVSYYLEKELIERVKGMADDNGSYYSALVGEALRRWVEKHGY